MIRPQLLTLLPALLLGCAFRLPDLPPLVDHPASGQRIFIVIQQGEANPGARQGYWSIASGLAAALDEAGFMPELVTSQGLVPAGFPIIENVRPGGECFSEPLLLVLSAGIIPHVGCVEFGHRFDLRRSASEPVQQVNTHYTVRALYGWLVAPLALLPQYVGELPSSHAEGREIPALRAAVLEALASAR